MSDLTDIGKNNNKILRSNKVVYEALSNYVLNNSLMDFLVSFRSPFLVGQDIFTGNIVDQTIRLSNPTMRFQPFLHSEQNGGGGKSSLNKHLYYLNSMKVEDKNKHNLEEFFNIGRLSDNDLTIVDYTVSKNHACIVKRNNNYYIHDLGTTNGTMVNHTALESNQKKQIHFNDLISFGRLGFLFMKPVNVFIFTRVQAEKEDTIRNELRKVLQFVKKSSLEEIANDLEIYNQEFSKSDLIRTILNHITPIEFLNKLF